MKKTLALILALMMAVCMFAACSKDEDKGKPAVEEMTGPEATLNKYLESIIECKALALNYTEYNTEGYFTSVEAINGQAILKGQLTDYIGAPESFEDQVSAYIDEFIEKAYSKASFKIESVEVDGDKATAAVITTSPSYYNISTMANEADMAALMAEHYPEGLESAPEEELNEAVFNLMKIVFDEIVANDEIYESESATIELEKIDGNWLVVNIF